MSKPTLYFTPGSPPARAVLLLCRELGIDVEVKTLDLLNGEHLKEEFLKLNPAHEVPTWVEGDFVLTESRAILAYIVNSRKPGSTLYPTEAKARAVVDQRLNYDSALFVKNGLFIVSTFYLNSKCKVTDFGVFSSARSFSLDKRRHRPRHATTSLPA